MRGAMRLAALMSQRVFYVMTHDSVGLGEDGPTHQPISQLMSLRLIPNMTVIRPSDANETVAAWRYAINKATGPVVLALTRQKLPIIDRKKYASADNVEHGAYILNNKLRNPNFIIIATGSELALALGSLPALEKAGINARIVSMPSWELFEAQSPTYKDRVLPPNITARLAIEAGVTAGWYKYVGAKGGVIGLDRFGASAPGKIVMDKLGFNVKNVLKQVKTIIGRNK
jgi:transketolase